MHFSRPIFLATRAEISLHTTKISGGQKTFDMSDQVGLWSTSRYGKQNRGYSKGLSERLHLAIITSALSASSIGFIWGKS